MDGPSYPVLIPMNPIQATILLLGRVSNGTTAHSSYFSLTINRSADSHVRADTAVRAPALQGSWSRMHAQRRKEAVAELALLPKAECSHCFPKLFLPWRCNHEKHAETKCDCPVQRNVHTENRR